MKNTAWVLLTFLLILAAVLIAYFEVANQEGYVIPSNFTAPTTTPQVITPSSTPVTPVPTMAVFTPVITEVPR